MPTAARILLVLAILLMAITTPAQADVEVPVGGIAIIGFNFDDPDEFSFVCTTAIPDGTEIRFTDNGWTNTGTFRAGEGILSWYTPGGCAVGQIVNIKKSEHTSNTTGTFDLSPSGSDGDQILVYQGFGTINHFIFAINSDGTGWTPTSNYPYNSARPTGLDSTNSIALLETDNAVYKGTKSFNSVSDGLAAIVNPVNWDPSDDVRQVMPTGTFSFGPTAIHLSTFGAQTASQPFPPFYLLALLIPPAVYFLRKRLARGL
ncbi:MAG: hypothetical protein ACYDH1_00965 [Anaerolineaceae bacterium]